MTYTFIAALAYLPLMEDWKTKNAPEEEKPNNTKTTDDETANNNINDDDDGFFGFGGDDDEDEGVGGCDMYKEEHFCPSHFVTLTSSKSLLYSLVPHVTMTTSFADFPPLEEEELTVFKFAPTLQFTLSLKLNFHGTEDRKATKMLEMLQDIRFLKELKLVGRIAKEDFREIGKLKFLESLDLACCQNLTDDYLEALLHPSSSTKDSDEAHLFSLKSLNLADWKRLTGKGLASVPLFAPNLLQLNLINCDNLRKNSSIEDALIDKKTGLSRLPKLRSFLIQRYVKSALIDAQLLTNVVSKFTNLRDLELRQPETVNNSSIILVAQSCPHLARLVMSGRSHVDDAGLGQVFKIRRETIEWVELGYCNMTEKSIEHFVDLPNLKYLCFDLWDSGEPGEGWSDHYRTGTALVDLIHSFKSWVSEYNHPFVLIKQCNIRLSPFLDGREPKVPDYTQV